MPRRFRRLLTGMVAAAAVLLVQLAVTPAAEAAKAPPWRWHTTADLTQNISASSDLQIATWCPENYRPVSIEWQPTPRTVVRLFEKYVLDGTRGYAYLSLRNTNTSAATVTSRVHCAHSDDLGPVDVNTVSIAHPVGYEQVGGYVDCDQGWGVLTGGADWIGNFSTARRIHSSSPTENGWYASGYYPSSTSLSLQVSVLCVQSSVLSGAHLVSTRVNVPSGQIVAATATCAIGERPAAVGAYQLPAGAGGPDPYLRLGETVQATQFNPINGAGRFTAWGAPPFPYTGTDIVARAWCVRFPIPVVTITSKPPPLQASHQIDYSFTAVDPAGDALTLTCTLAGGFPLPCANGPVNTTSFGDGTRTVYIRASNSLGHVDEETFTVTVDSTPPNVQVNGKPADPTSTNSATFGVTTFDMTATTTTCRLDDEVEHTCPASSPYSALADGPHTFHWRAVDAAGNETTGSHTWRVDTTEPIVTVMRAPAAVTRSKDALFEVSATDEAGTVMFCHLDDQPDAPCGSSSYTGLAEGLHTWHWRVVDEAGNETAGAHTWRIDTIAPTAQLTAPTAPFSLGSVRVTWTGGDSGSGIASWQLRRRTAPYNAGFGAYSAPATYAPGTLTTLVGGLARGSTYCWQVRSLDKAAIASAWSPERCSALPLDDRALAVSAGWSRITGAGYYAGTATQTTKLGAVLTRSGAQLKRLAVVATKCPTCGIAGLYVNGIRVGTVDLYRATAAHQQLVVLPAFTYRTGTVTLKALTSGELVRIDGLGISRS